MDEVGALAAGDDGPFVEPGDGHQEASALEGGPEAGFLGHGLGPGVDELGRAGFVLGPAGTRPQRRSTASQRPSSARWTITAC